MWASLGLIYKYIIQEVGAFALKFGGEERHAADCEKEITPLFANASSIRVDYSKKTVFDSKPTTSGLSSYDDLFVVFSFSYGPPFYGVFFSYRRALTAAPLL